ncbi:MAG TPA: short-chain dehydrogenase [Acidimicrobiaceae bacterium]|nr:short-chain dehydrogenase [Acidimicrobiaceae bacterium]
MQSFVGKIAVVTGGGTGMGRELVRQLAADSCHVAMCDVSADDMAETLALALADAPDGTKVTAHLADVSDEAQVEAFRDGVVAEHCAGQTSAHINLLFNNAGIGGGGSFVADPRPQWEKTFNVCWGGVYLMSRAFMPLLVASDEGHIVNTSSVNGFWASLGPTVSHTAYSAAKFAVKGFTEALITDLRVNAPHVKASVVMPGHIGTSIAINSAKAHGRDPKELTADQLQEVRARLARQGMDVIGASDDDLRVGMQMQAEMFRDSAPMTAAQAATVILDGVRAERWRILVGDDAAKLDALVRQIPEEAYELSFQDRLREGNVFDFTRE